MGKHPRFENLRRKAPLLIILAIAITLVVYVAVEILIETMTNSSWTSGPLINATMQFTRNLTQTISSWGYIGIFGLMVIEASSFPIPSEIILPFSGFLVSRDVLNLWATIFIATLGVLIGSFIDYYIGLKGYQAITKYRFFGRSICTESQLQTATKWFTRYGSIMVFAARLVPVFRTIISFPAGAVRMPIVKFAIYTFAGSAIWNTLLIYLGYYLVDNWVEVVDIAQDLIIISIVAFFTLTIYLIIRRRRRNTACKQSQKA